MANYRTARLLTSLKNSAAIALLCGFSAFNATAQESSGVGLEVSEKVLAAEADRIAAIKKATMSTVGVFSDKGEGGGSGVIISKDGYVLTNFHVSSPFGHQMRCGLSDGRMFDAVVVGIDPTGDLALLKMFEEVDLPAATIADSNTVQQGDWCFAAGNPFVLATNLEPTVTWGLVSGTHRYQYPSGSILEYTDCIQTDAAINPGNSGGPLYNANGDLIGINGRCSFEKRGRVNVGVGYAISINQAMLFLKHLRSGRIVDHATLGFTVSGDVENRVLVSNILESSDAFRRGLRYDDEILSLGGRKIETRNELLNLLGIYPARYRLPMTYRQGNEVKETWIRLDALHTDAELQEIVEGESESGKERPKRKGDGEKKPGDPAEGNDAENPTSTKDADESQSELSKTFQNYEAKQGFANAWFNAFELDRIAALDDDRKAWTDSSGQMLVSGTLLGETTTVSAELTGRTISTTIADQRKSIPTKSGWSPVVDSRSLHAFGIAMQLWHDWQTKKPALIGATTYIGGGAVVGESEQFDLVQITAADVEAYFYTDNDSGKIRLIELAADQRQDRFEFYIDSYQQLQGKSFPMQVRFGYAIDELTPAKFENLELKSAPAAPEAETEKSL